MSTFQAGSITVPTQLPEILKDLNREILRHQPKDITLFCADYFQKKLAEQRGGLIGVRMSQSRGRVQLFSEVSKRMYFNLVHAESAATTTTADTANTIAVDARGPPTAPVNPVKMAPPPPEKKPDADQSSDEDDVLDEAPRPPINFNRERRTSVSAESMAPSQDKDYVKINVPKSREQRTRIENSIQNNFLFKSLDEEQHTDVVNAMTEKDCKNGDSIIQQGGIGDYFYVIESGSFHVFVSRNGKPAIKVCDYGPGGSFGELALMYNAPRAATVTATSDSVVWALDRVTFRRILMENTNKKRRLYESFLEEVPILMSLEAYERHKISDALESVAFNDGDVIIKQGDVGDAFYILESGEVGVTLIDEKGEAHEFPELQRGSYFGGMSFIRDIPVFVFLSSPVNLTNPSGSFRTGSHPRQAPRRHNHSKGQSQMRNYGKKGVCEITRTRR